MSHFCQGLIGASLVRSIEICLLHFGHLKVRISSSASIAFILARALTSYDVGIAGIHRLFASLKVMMEKDVDILIVIAGREGALPSVVAGLVDVPIIAVPTSIGYGYGDDGVGALMSMLQTCSLDIATVNIDGGIPAGIVAALIANRVARARL